MEATLKYNLDVIDDELALNRSLKATDMALILFEIQYNLRKKCIQQVEHLYGTDSGYDEYGAVDMVFDYLNDLFDEHNVNLNDLIR